MNFDYKFRIRPKRTQIIEDTPVHVLSVDEESTIAAFNFGRCQEFVMINAQRCLILIRADLP